MSYHKFRSPPHSRNILELHLQYRHWIFTSVSCVYVQFKAGFGAYKMPSINTPLRANFWFFDSRRHQTVGSGSKMITMSMVMFIIAAVSSNVLTSMHWCGIEMSQEALMGLKLG